MSEETTRRAVLGALGTAAAGTLAGCGSSTEGETTSEAGAAATTGSTTATETATATPERAASASTAADDDSVYTAVYRDTIGSVALVRSPSGSQGSAFLYDDTHLVTNYHVVGTADRMSVQFADGTSQVGSVLGRDPRSDLAVIEIEAVDGHPPLSLVDAQPTIGTRVAVVGSPYGLQGSLTSGIVSGVDRQVPSPAGDYPIPNAIQTDAPVNPGNSGGPLVDLQGNVLGVVNSGGGDNIAFAISAPLVDRVVSGIVDDGEYEHPYLGVDTIPVTDLVARANDLEEARGVLVRALADDAPAAGELRAATGYERVRGFRVPVGGDVILAVDGEEIGSPKELHAHLALNVSPGETVPMRVRRDGEVIDVDVEVGVAPEATPSTE
ncbi:S1C family serine protease [Candidatus Halobonum tyrrellensis]|uniref:Serine protease HtrA n=1 Tax=Candidatus Halobonum tyrrellensis G22 TaxID=1324957 RepID=V4HDW3_9EURY|nr:trypsin-like peptidase domain-containing protein [Candidatus Halobonum tyrrellensis]ESP88258.1 serine protease HtrA [Candidatus Halobonum tyrrellensis G22]